MIRGAYMNEERALAEEKGCESPVWDTIEETHNCYNSNLEKILRNVEGNDCVFVASHNQDSVEVAKKVIKERKISLANVRFGQLKAFSDQITQSLALENHQVFKYLPYGPTEKVMPYLVRRGQESKQVLREQKFQNEFLKSEIKARLLRRY